MCLSPVINFWPQLTHYQQLYEENPTALFILNQRNPLQILNSMKNWNHLNQRILKYNPELFMSYSGLDDDKKILTLIEDHYRAVHAFFKSKPTARYMEYEIETDHIEKLYPYIPEIRGVPVFPHENIGIYRGKSTKSV